MPAGPKDKSEAAPGRRDPVTPRDPVTLWVALGMVGLTVGGIMAIFSAPLLALFSR
ncbi:MAG TPA: hypothetical protein VHO06_15185 [Polyangia bacterium]|nr:hypothetical protein [Polyangia bacterium]